MIGAAIGAAIDIVEIAFADTADVTEQVTAEGTVGVASLQAWFQVNTSQGRHVDRDTRCLFVGQLGA